jgi:hypothetical protein
MNIDYEKLEQLETVFSMRRNDGVKKSQIYLPSGTVINSELANIFDFISLIFDGIVFIYETLIIKTAIICHQENAFQITWQIT